MFRHILDNPILVAVSAGLVVVMGVLSVTRVPIQLIPDLDVRVVTVVTRWAGASPQDVEKEILIEQEEFLSTISGIDRMVSRASMGRAEIALEFPFGTDIDDILVRVNNALTRVPSYPENVDEPRIVANSFSDNSFLFFGIYPLPGNDAEIDTFFDQIDERVRMQIARVPGVSDADLRNGVQRQVRINVDPKRLADRGISINEVRDAIRSRNRDVSAGDLDSGKRRYVMRTIGRFRSAEEINDLVIGQRGGALVRLRDVGFAELDFEERRRFGYFNESPVVVLTVRREPGSNIVAVRDAVKQRMEELDATVLADLGLTSKMFVDDAKYVEDAVAVVRQNLLLGALLATIVLFLFLRAWRPMLIGAIGIPICLVAAFLGLQVMGRTINVISLAGVAFAIGMTLDNSIVVLENIHSHRSAGKTGFDAALTGVSEVWKAVLASTLTTIFVFVPVLFVQQQAGQLYSDIAVAISASILMSMLVAFTIVPVGTRAIGGFAKTPEVGSSRSGLTPILKAVSATTSSANRQFATLAIVLGITAAILFYLTPKAEYLPEGEEPKAFSTVTAPPGYSLEESEVIGRQIRAFLRPHVEADPAAFEAGETDFPPIEFAIQFVGAGSVRTIMPSVDAGHIDELVNELSRHLEQYPGVRAFVSRGSIFSGNSGGTRSINIDISGRDIEALYDAAAAVFEKAKTAFDRPQVRAQPAGLVLAQPFLEIRPDWERAAELGVSTAALGYSVWAYSDGAFVDEFFLGDDKIDMYLYSTEGTVRNPEDISDLYIYTQAGAAVPLSSVASVVETTSTAALRRVDGRRTITVSIIPPRSVPLEVGVERVRDDIIGALKASGEVAPEIGFSLSGASDRLDATREALAGNFAVALLITYFLLVAILVHWGYPLIIMITVPVGVSGGIAGLALLNGVGGLMPLVGFDMLHQPLDMITMLGFLVLVGTVVNNPILIVDRTMHNARELGMANREAIMAAVSSRMRPILMSTITTVLGLSPLVFIPGAGTELYRGLGAVVLFGILYSAVVTLFFLPSLMCRILDARDWLVGRIGRAQTPADTAGASAD